jgi:hypothetical protein
MKLFLGFVLLLTIMLTGCAQKEVSNVHVNVPAEVNKVQVNAVKLTSEHLKSSVQLAPQTVEIKKPIVVVPDALDNKGKLISFRYAMESNSLSENQLAKFSIKLDALISTLEPVTTEPLATDDFFEADYGNVKLYLLPGAEFPELNILVKKDDTMFVFKGDKAVLDAIFN